LKNKLSIFDIQTPADFEAMALQVFAYQYQHCAVYQQYCQLLKLEVSAVKSVQDIPFLPIEVFKHHRVSDQAEPTNTWFQSSGTGLMQRSKHYIADTEIYQQSIEKTFAQFIGKPQDFVFIGLLPSYIENQHSSLIYMVNHLMTLSQQPENAYYLDDHHQLNQTIISLESQKKPYVLFGVSFALLDFIDDFPQHNLQYATVIETGGMKGRKTEIGKNQLLEQLQNGLHGAKICSEYSMCELQSQAYALGQNIYHCPPWMQVYLRDLDDPLSHLSSNRTGGINIIDLANWHSCAFVATQDLGRKYGDSFEVLGRMDHSDLRGCSLLVV
jgi:Acyl-protein synthetase, LuxE